MRLIIAGSRNIRPSVSFLDGVIYDLLSKETVTEVVSGGCKGVDEMGEYWAKNLNHDMYLQLEIPVKKFLPNWDLHGKAAGPLRNKEMADYGDALLLIWDGESRGSLSMKKEMLKLEKPIYEVILKRSV